MFCSGVLSVLGFDPKLAESKRLTSAQTLGGSCNLNPWHTHAGIPTFSTSETVSSDRYLYKQIKSFMRVLAWICVHCWAPALVTR